MFQGKLKEILISLVSTRVLYLLLAFAALFSILVHRIFTLQIIEGESYVNDFQATIKKERTIDAARGNIYDRNGVILACNELAYSVKIEDVYESGKEKNKNLNNTIIKTIAIIEENGNSISTDFNVKLNEKNEYEFGLSGTRLQRFKADVYGCKYIDDMTFAQSSSTADELMEYLISDKRFDVDAQNLTKDTVLKVVAIRYAMSANTYQKYISTTIATNVSEKCVAVIMENSDILRGVSIAEDTIRVYPTGIYTSQIIGYTGKISSDELEELSATDDSYGSNDIIGKTGIERSMESVLKGNKGSETVFVDTMGKVISSESLVQPSAGKDLYLTIDSELQEAIYHILEQKLAGILLKKIVNTKEYVMGEDESSADILIPIYDVYIALFQNSVIDIKHLCSEDASESEKTVYEAFCQKKEKVISRLDEELTTKKTPYKKLTTEWKVYENYAEDILLDYGILDDTLIDKTDETYKAWATQETISLCEYLKYAISQNWISTDKLDLEEAYSEADEIYDKILNLLENELKEDSSFDRTLFKYIIKDDMIKPRVICNVLLDQGIVELDDDEKVIWEKSRETAFEFMRKRIENLEITPAQLALDPYSASMVVADVNSGDVLASVSYPSYDNNYLANGADADYLRKINADLSTPMINYATQQKTAPGSTFKMVSATAGLCEGVVNTNTIISCMGSFTEITDTHNCWIYPGRHGPLNVTGAIQKSCNYYFYTVGYRLSLDESGKYNSNLGIEKLTKYAEMFGLGEKSGMEIEESTPTISTMYSVPSAIGQGTNNFTTASLCRYIVAVANSGTVYNLTLLDKLCESDGSVIKEYEPTIYNTIEMDEKYWDAIHLGMKRVVEDKSYFADLPLSFAGKTGTAQQSRTRADHGLFVCYAPYDDPQISIAVRIANGYTSEYVADTTKDVLRYYFNISEEEEIVTGTASEIEVSHVSGD